MNNKAFTLVELLGVLIILSIMLVLVFPSVTHIINQGKETTYQVQINKILRATYDYSLKNTSILPQNNEISFVTLGELKQEGFIDNDVTNPDTSEPFPNDLIITIKNTNSKNYDKKVSKKEGSYLYTIVNQANNLSAPTITLPFNKNSDGNYIVSLELNEAIPDISAISYTATTSSGVDITDRVKYFITKGDLFVNSIDTSSFGIYKLNFVVVDDDDNFAKTVLNIIVGDSTIPILNIPANETLSVGSSPIDLLNGASCEDNSGFCNIETSGTIDYNTADIYTVTYTATDPSGNVTTKERIITIE